MDECKIQSIRSWPILASTKELHGFLGLTGYYRRFTKGYGIISRPLIELLKKNNFMWTTAATKAFKALKTMFTRAPILAFPNFNETFVVESDASSMGIGAVLAQGGKPIAFFSKALNPRHQTFSVYEREMLVILTAVKKWSVYLLGRQFKIKIDHESLKFLLDQTASTPAQHKWMLQMMPYDFKVVYRKGTSNTVTDVLSRQPQATLHALLVISTDLIHRIKASYIQNSYLALVIQKLRESNMPQYKYSLLDDQLH